MAHMVESMMYAGETPWHGLGTKVEGDALRDWRKTMEAAGLDWRVGFLDLYTADGRQVDHRATVRESDRRILGVVGPSFTILQNEDAFEWFSPFLDAGAARFEAAGSLAGGSRIWALASIGAEAEVDRGDEVRRYVLLSHSHDGSLAVRVGFTDVRVVCNNTLTMAHKSREGSQLIRLKHTMNVKDNLAAVRETMDLARAGFYATVEQFQRLRQREINQNDLEKYVQLVLGAVPTADGSLATRTQNRINEIVRLANEGQGNDGSTLWDAFNGLTEYVTWQRGRTPETRLASTWYGDGAQLLDKGLKVALEMAEVAR